MMYVFVDVVKFDCRMTFFMLIINCVTRLYNFFYVYFINVNSIILSVFVFNSV